MVCKSVLIAGLVLGGLGGFGGGDGFGQRSADRAVLTHVDGTVVSLEVADSEAERQRGLMFRERLADTEGMLFVFDQPGFYPFWMQNCRIALDIIWVDAAMRVVSVAPSAPPCRMAGCEPPCASPACPTIAPEANTTATYVVELAAGSAARHGLQKGQTLALKLPSR